MKKLLRTSLIALLLAGACTGFAVAGSATHMPIPKPQVPLPTAR